jgi:hypothetical protein
MADSTADSPQPKPTSRRGRPRKNPPSQGAEKHSQDTKQEPQVVPRSPDTEKGQQSREQYLACAQVVLHDTKMTYVDLYNRYASGQSQTQQLAQALDQAVATVALKAGNPPRQVIQMLAQGPFTQHQVRDLSPEEKKVVIPKLLAYAQSTVEGIQRQRFIDYANAVTGKTWSYPELYREHIGTDLTAIQLDQKVTAAALQAGEVPESVMAFLQEGPYARFQRDMKQVDAETLEQYARGTIAQVQSIQSLKPGQKSAGLARGE